MADSTSSSTSRPSRPVRTGYELKLAENKKPSTDNASSIKPLTPEQQGQVTRLGTGAKPTSPSVDKDRPSAVSSATRPQDLTPARSFAASMHLLPKGTPCGDIVPVHQFMRKSQRELAELSEVFVESIYAMQDAKLDVLMRDYGASEKEWKAFQTDYGARYANSASAGQQLLHPNDHDGILIVPAPDGDRSVAERFVVITEVVDGGKRYFVKGEGNRIVNFKQLDKALLDLLEPGPESRVDLDDWLPRLARIPGADGDDSSVRVSTADSSDDSSVRVSSADSSDDELPTKKVELETQLRTRVHQLSEESSLCARSDPRQSDTKLLPKPPNAAQTRTEQKWWSNQEPSLCGFGGIDKQGYHRLYFDYNQFENRLLIIKCSKFKSNKGTDRRPLDKDDKKINITIGGTVLAIINGIKPFAESGIEVVNGPPGQPGIKGAKFRPTCCVDPDQPIVVRITTSDNAVHELTLTTEGCHLKLVNPQKWLAGGSSMAFGANRDPVGDIDVYTYNGVDTGSSGSPDGFPDPTLESSFGDQLLAGPLLIDRGGVMGAARAAMTSVGRLVTLTSRIGGDRGYAAVVLNFFVKNLLTATVAAGFSQVANAAQDEDTHTILGGNHTSYNSAGAGHDPGNLTGYIFAVVFAQQVVTRLVNLAARGLPPEYYESVSRNLLTRLLGHIPNMLVEYGRLATNLGIGRGLGVRQGDSWLADASYLMPAAALGGLREYAESRSGAASNHPVVAAGYQVFKGSTDMVFRAVGSAAAAGNWTVTQLEFAEALVTRAIGRSYDKILGPVAGIIANAIGLWGDNADAFDHQLSRETRGINFAGLENGVDQLTKAADDVIQRVMDTEEVRELLLGYEDWTAQLAQWRDTALMKEVQGVAKEILYAQKSGEYARLESDAARQDLLGEIHVRYAKWVDEGITSLADRERLPGEMLAYSEELLAKSAEEYPVEQMLDGRSKAHGGESDWHSDTRKVKKKYGTFSRSAQAKAKPVHDAMLRFTSMGDRVTAKHPKYPTLLPQGAPPLDKLVTLEIQVAVRHYSEESGLFHYPLRYQHTGQPKVIPIVAGINFTHSVMTRADNSRQVDPVKALYLNLGAHYAVTYPGVFYRAVVTEAAYHPSDSDRKSTAGRIIKEGEFVALTEVLSGSTCTHLANSWGNALALAHVPLDRSQLIVMNLEAVTNIARFTENVQGEVIAQPGGLLHVTKVHPVKDARAIKYDTSSELVSVSESSTDKDDDANGGNDAKDQESTRKISQTVYVQQVNTYDLECAYHRLQDAMATDSEWRPADGELMIEPRSGHFYAYSAEDDGIVFASVAKNYFLGRNLEETSKEDPSQPAIELARWLHPYTSDSATRGIKDAAHAAILQKSPICKYLDIATSNFSHAYFRNKGGFATSEAGKAELAEIKAIRDQANNIVQGHIKDLTLDTELNPDPEATDVEDDVEDVSGLTWLLTSMLRQPILLVPLEDADKGRLFHKTYDKVDSLTDIDGRPKQPVMIGWDNKGFRSIKSGSGELKAGGGKDLTVESFLHVFLLAAAEPGSPSSQGKTREAASQLLGKLKEFAQVDYLVLQRELIRTYAPTWKPPAHTRRPGGPDPQGASHATTTVLRKVRHWETQGGQGAAMEGIQAGEDFLKETRIVRVPNPGATRELSLLFALVQHAKGAFDNGHFAVVERFMTEVTLATKEEEAREEKAKVGAGERGRATESLSSLSESAPKRLRRETFLRAAVRQINEYYGTKHDVVVTTVNMQGMAMACVIQHDGAKLFHKNDGWKPTKTAITVVWRADKGEDRYEALTMGREEASDAGSDSDQPIRRTSKARVVDSDDNDSNSASERKKKARRGQPRHTEPSSQQARSGKTTKSTEEEDEPLIRHHKADQPIKPTSQANVERVIDDSDDDVPQPKQKPKPKAPVSNIDGADSDND